MLSRNRFSFRLALVGVTCAAGALTVLSRMVYLSVLEGPGLIDDLGYVCGETVKMSYRGPILDRNGAALATSMESYRVAVRRAEYRYDPDDAAVLAPLLRKDVDELDDILRDHPGKFIWLSRAVTVESANALKQLRMRGIDVHRDQLRAYPQGPLAAHVVGFSGADAQGLEGIERVFDKEIRGKPVSRRVCKDARGRVFLSNDDSTGVNHGASVQLTIDATLQSIAETELNREIDDVDAVGGSVVILDPATGEILALANAPAFDPNLYGDTPPAARRNRVVTDIFEPGSTLKPLLVAAAMDAGVVTGDERFFCENGAMRVGGWTIHDHHPHDVLTVADTIKVSSNICSAKIGDRLGVDLYHSYLLRFGFASRPGSGMPGEVPGLLAAPSKWRPIQLANISFGQGIGVTALQMASAVSAIANDGLRMQPYIVRKVTAPDGALLQVNDPEVAVRVVSPAVAREVALMMESVVAPGGTAPRARVDGIRVAGKTGTAQKAEKGGYSKDRWLASFVGFLPADAPRMVIAVTVDEPRRSHYGGVVAAPIFRRIAEASLDYLHIHRMPTVPARSVSVAARLPEIEEGPMPAFNGTMPDLQGLSLRAAMRAIDGCRCRVQVDGSGYIVSQHPEPGIRLAATDSVRLELARSTGP